MISPNRVKFQKIFSNELNIPDLIMECAFESDNSEVSTYLNREAVSVESYDGRHNNAIRYKYSERFSPRFTFMKKGFGDFDSSELRAVLKWLTSSDTPTLLDVYYDDSNVVGFSAVGNWTEISSYKLANSRTVAVVATFEAIAPYAMSGLYGRDDDDKPIVYDVTQEINTTMYYWTSTLVSGTSVPQYVLTSAQTPIVGTQVYSVPSALSGSIIATTMTFYGEISKVNDDGSYVVNTTTFKLTSQGTKIKRTYDNKITINIDTDDNKPVYPRITIQEKGIVVPITPDTTLNFYSDMVPNTVYSNGTMCYWKTASTTPIRRNSTIKPEYDWTVVTIDRDYTDEDIIEENALYYNPNSQTYFWIDPYTFHSDSVNNIPDLKTTGVKITNQHYDFFNRASTPVTMVVKNNSSTEKVVVDGANEIISSTNTRRIFGNDFNLIWLPLYDGKNELTVEGNCTVTLEYREIRKVGEY